MIMSVYIVQWQERWHGSESSEFFHFAV